MDAKKLLNSKERKFYILARMINGENVSYQKLSDDYFVSRSSIANDIISIKKRLSKDNIPLLFNNSGSYIGGGEIDKQKIIKRVVIDLLGNKEGKQLISLFIDSRLLKTIFKLFHQKLQAWKLEVPENNIGDISISTAILVFRGMNGYQISWKKKDQLDSVLMQFDKYPLVYQLLKTVEESEIYHFNDTEMQYLYYIIIGNGFNFFMNNGQIPAEFKSEVKQLIVNVSDSLNIDLTKDSSLLEKLLVHLYQMKLRLESKTTVINPLLQEIKNNYPDLYGVVWYALSEFSENNHLVVSDDEVGFVTLHFQAAVERNKEINRILFVCPNGIGMSSLICAKMKRILPAAALTEVTSKHDLVKKDLSNVSLIISTVKLSEQHVPVVNISPIMTISDMKKIASSYIDVVTKQSVEKKDEHIVINDVGPFLKGNIFFMDEKVTDNIIDVLLKSGTWNDEKSFESYKKSLKKREELQSTYISNGFAIPHGDPKFITKSSIAVAILDKPVNWGNNRVDIIAMLMIKRTDKKIVEPFMNLIMHGIKNKEWFISKMMEVK